MRVFFTFFLLMPYFLISAQSGTLGPVTSSVCNTGCNASQTAPYCTTCGSNVTGNCTEYAVTEIVSVPANSTVSITITNANCGASGEFDTNDEFTFLANGVLTSVAGTGTDGESVTRCFDNPSSGPIDVVFGYRANRRDEYATYSYTISSGTGTGCLVLPVAFSNFNTKMENEFSYLSFSTASETNNDYFTIERSGDGRSFDAIGEIKGAGNSNQELSYEFVDESPLAGINYYRIKQTDYDGAYSYTEIRSVRHQTKNVIVSPNRTDGKLNVTSELDNYDVVIYNTGGQEVQRHMALSGDQSLSIESLQTGVYFVKVMDQTIRILKF